MFLAFSWVFRLSTSALVVLDRVLFSRLLIFHPLRQQGVVEIILKTTVHPRQSYDPEPLSL